MFRQFRIGEKWSKGLLQKNACPAFDQVSGVFQFTEGPVGRSVAFAIQNKFEFISDHFAARDGGEAADENDSMSRQNLTGVIGPVGDAALRRSVAKRFCHDLLIAEEVPIIWLRAGWVRIEKKIQDRARRLFDHAGIR